MKDRFKKRPLSHSQLSSFEYSPAQWYESYILGKRFEGNAFTDFGSKVGNFLEKDPTYLPEITRYDTMEYEFRTSFNGIHLLGFADTFCSKTKKKIGEYKTGIKPWTQKRVDDHKQLTNYVLQNYIKNKVAPEDVDIFLTWLPTAEQGDFTIDFTNPDNPEIHTFHTKRTMHDVLEYGVYINETIKKMEEYIKSKENVLWIKPE